MFHNYICIAVNIYIYINIYLESLEDDLASNTSVSFRVDLLIREWKDQRLNIQLLFLLKQQSTVLFYWYQVVSNFETSPSQFPVAAKVACFLIYEHFIGAPDGFHTNGDVKRNGDQTRQAPSNDI